MSKAEPGPCSHDQVISRDALRMRLRRLCARKKSGSYWVADDVVMDYEKGGAAREALEITLLETLRSLGPNDQKPTKVRVGFAKGGSKVLQLAC